MENKPSLIREKGVDFMDHIRKLLRCYDHVWYCIARKGGPSLPTHNEFKALKPGDTVVLTLEITVGDGYPELLKTKK